MNLESIIDWDEMFEYLPGTTVELKIRPGVIDQIEYKPVQLSNNQSQSNTFSLNQVKFL